MERAMPVDAAISAPTSHHDLHKTSFAEQALGEPLEARRWELAQQINELALDVVCDLCFAGDLLNIRLRNGCFPAALLLEELNPFPKDCSRLFW